MRKISSAGSKLGEANERLRYIQAALKQTPQATAKHFEMHSPTLYIKQHPYIHCLKSQNWASSGPLRVAVGQS